MAASTSDFLSSIALEDFSGSLPSPHLVRANLNNLETGKLLKDENVKDGKSISKAGY